ncbi:MAG: bifunctional DNA-binding transcriptional regulator/O6-methylguanine-DNA methyltransferase Ada [Sphingobium sp.]
MAMMEDRETAMPDADICWAAFVARDRGADGHFVGAVHTTGIYCRPSCPARRPARENMLFYSDGAAAQAAGYRACLRCRPDGVARDAEAVGRALALLDAAEAPPTLGQLAAKVGYAPDHFQRLFKRAVGTTPAAYARTLRAQRLAAALRGEDSVTAAIYEAGYGAPSRAYADAAAHLGMTPSAWRAGGAGVMIRHAVVDTSLGPLLIAATPRGLCRVAFDEDADALRARFPHAELIGPDADFERLAATVRALVDQPGEVVALPVDTGGTAFQQAVWQALRAIPPGETRSYGEIAAAAGRPGAVRAAGSACGANPIAMVVPCHRVLRADGALGGYAYGTDRKQSLLAREQKKD